MNHRFSAARRIIVIAAAASAAFITVSCQDDPVRLTGPVRKPLTKPIAPTADYTPVGDAVPVPLADSVSPGGSAALPYFAKTTLVRVTVSGEMTTRLTPYNDGNPSSPPAPGAPRTFGPGGYYWGSPANWSCGASVRVSYAGGESFWPECASDRSTDALSTVSAHIMVQGVGSAARTTAAPGTTGANDCSYYAPNFFSGWGPCFYYSTSGQSVSIERVRADLDLIATPDTPDYQDSVSFTASVSPGSAGGRDVPWTIDSVRWEAQDGSYSGWSQPCAWNNFQPVNTGAVRTCRGVVTKSGTLTVHATVNGETQSRAAYVVVRRPKLVVAPNYSYVLTGGTLSHEATVIPATKANGQPVSWQVTSWRFQQGKAPFWTGQSCGAVTQCNTGPYQMADDGSRLIVYATINGTADSAEAFMRVRPSYLKLTAMPDFISSGDTVSFAATVSPASGHTLQITGWRWDPSPDVGGISADCSTGENPCVRSVTKSGMMTVFGTVDGQYADSAMTPVVVFGLQGGGSGCVTSPTVSRDSLIRRGAKPRVGRPPPRPSFGCEPPPLPAGKINLVCRALVNGQLRESGEVRRGEKLTCTAGGPQAGDRVTVSQWKWVYGAGTPFAGLQIGRTDAQKTLPVWAGNIALGGHVIVSGSINGTAAQPDTAVVVPLARAGWTNLHPFEPMTVVTNDLPSVPKSFQEFGKFPWPKISIPAGVLDTIKTGPNERVVHLKSMYTVMFVTRVNMRAMSADSAFALMQPATPTGTLCGRTFLTETMPDLVRAHEGTAFQTQSHAGVFRDSLRAQNTGSIVEALAHLSISDIDVKLAIKTQFEKADSYSKEQAEGGLVPGIPTPGNCKFNYQP